MFDSRTGSSCLRKAKDVFSHAFVEPGQIQHVKKDVWHAGYRTQYCIINTDISSGLKCMHVVHNAIKQSISHIYS